MKTKRAVIFYLLISAILIAGLEVCLSLFFKRYSVSRLKKELFVQADLLKDLLPEKKELNEFCNKYKNLTAARITVVDHTGRVLCDSEDLASKIENHLNRPEIKEATLSGTGYSIRLSKTFGKEFLYVAIKAETISGKKFVRLSKSLDTVNREISRTRMPLMITALLVLILIATIWGYQTNRMRTGIREITEFVDRVTSGKWGSKLFIEGDSELKKLGGHVSYMAEELQRRIDETKKEKQIIEAMLKHMGEGLLIIDGKGSVVLINESLKKILGVTDIREEMTAMEIMRNAGLVSLIEESKRKDDTVSGEIFLRAGIYLLVKVAPFEVSEKNRGFMITFQDITQIKRLEQMRRNFVANVAHEVKTPITAIKGFAETLLDGAFDDRESAIRFLEIIKKHSDRLNSLVSDLLTLSAIEQGEVRFEITNVNLSELIDSLFTLMEKNAKKKGLYLKKMIPEETNLIRADRDKLVQILLNLLDNAIKFTDRGGVVVGAEKLGDGLILYIEDTGCGIEKKHLPRLGERFYRVDRSRSRELGGTGLGLAIVKHLVRGHGWEMEIESTPNVGTKVKILIPP